MADTTIEWADKVWNPMTGCTKVSPGCSRCYAETVDHRFDPDKVGRLPWAFPASRGGRGVTLHPERLEQPLHWAKPRRIFVNSMSDLFHEDVPFEFISAVFFTMAKCLAFELDHQFQILTKRPERMMEWLQWANETFTPLGATHQHCLEVLARSWPLTNVWLGVSVENQLWADRRRPYIEELAKMGWLTWVSYEPALGPVDWAGWEFLRWLVSGGESGPKARPSHPDYHRGARDFCQENSIAYFFKQWGEYCPSGRVAGREVRVDGNPPAFMQKVGKKAAGAVLDGREWRQMPEVKV